MLVAALLWAAGRAACRRLFAWLPLPLWCYVAPMLLRACGLLPAEDPAYGWMSRALLPVSLALLLLGINWPALLGAGRRSLAAVSAGAAGILIGGPIMLLLLHGFLPAESWKGIGALAGTWTGGSLNMVALQAVLDVPEPVFAPLIVVDALVTYSWMSLLIAAKSLEPSLDRWLNAPPAFERPPGGDAASSQAVRATPARIILALGLALGLTGVGVWLGGRLPLTGPVSSAGGWAVLIVTSLALALACVPAIRRAGEAAGPIGYACLYVVLASLGAKASLGALAATPAWIGVGFGWMAIHAATLLLAGKLLRLPVGLLATASQANVGGVVSAPMVGAIYDPRLAPIGLVLAIGCNALGTYLGLLAATLARWAAGG